MHECQRCGNKEMSGFIVASGASAGNIRLLGDVHAWLCTICANTWGDALRAAPVWEEWLHHTAQKEYLDGRKHTLQHPRLREQEAHTQENERLSMIIREMALAFIRPVPLNDTGENG